MGCSTLVPKWGYKHASIGLWGSRNHFTSDCSRGVATQVVSSPWVSGALVKIGAKTVRQVLSRRVTSAIVATAILASAFTALAITQNQNAPQSSPPGSLPTAIIVSPWAVLDPSTSANDKDGFPPTQSQADPEEAFLLGKITTTEVIYSPSATVLDYNYDSVNDLIVDDDTPRNLDALDGLNDGQLAVGTYYIYWNLNKTGYVPVNTTPGSDYNGSNSASLSLVNDMEQFQLQLNFSTTEGGSMQTITSDLYTIEMGKTSSIGQNDLDWIDTEPKVVIAETGDLFHVRSKYKQSSAQGLDWFILQCYFNGVSIRMRSVSMYFYDNFDPGSIVNGVPPGYSKYWTDKQQYTGSDLGDTTNKDFWVTDYTFEVREKGFSEVIPYIQTKKGGDTWKVDTGYRNFQSHVPGGVNPAVLDISKYFSESFPGGVVSGPNPPIVGETTVYEISINVANTGADTATNVVVTDTAQLSDVTWLGIYTVTQGSLSFNPLTGKITWSVGMLAPNTSATLNYQVSVLPGPEKAGQTIMLNAGAYATGKSKTSGTTISDGPTPPLYTEPVVGLPQLTFTKTADQDTADPGDQITYTLHYANTGSSIAYDVEIQDTIPDHVTYVSSSPPYSTVSGKVYTWNIGDVNAGASGEVTITVQVDAGTPDGTVLANLGTVKYNGPGGPEPPVDDWKNITVTAPVMSFSKTADVTTADPGDLIIYTLAYHNAGNGTATGVVIVDTNPEYTTFVSSSPSPSSVNGRIYTYDIGSVPAETSGTVVITVKVNAGTPDGTILENVAVMNYDDANGNPYPEEPGTATTTVTAPVMTFDKSADVATANPGDQITYTLSYHNTGSGTATGVVIQDTIPEHVTFISSTPSPSSISGRVYTYSIGSVAGGASGTVTIVVKVNAFVPDGTQLVNVATFNYDDANGNSYPEKSDSATTTVIAPVMTFTKTASAEYADPGDEVTYTLAYENTGTGWATGVVVTDTIPDHVTYVSSSPGYDSVSGRTYTWNVGDVGPGDDGTITITVEINAGTPDQTGLTDHATLDYADANGNIYPQMTDCATTTVTAPVMTFTKSADVSQADPGDVITYTLHYKNTGTGVATGVVVKDTISSYTTFYDANPSYSSVNGRTYTWNVGTVPAGSEGDIILKVKVNAGVPDGTEIPNTATLDYDDANGNPDNQLSDEVTVTVTAPVMSFSKVADVQFADPGDTITYTLTYSNEGAGWATGVVVTDTIPELVTFQTANPWYTSVSSRTYSWDIGDVAPENSGTITVTVNVDVGVTDQAVLTNAATFNYDDANGNPGNELSDSASTTVTAPVMTFSKSADVAFADPGDYIQYTLTYENIGTGVATGVIVKDTIPDGVAFVSSSPSYSSVSGKTYEWDVGTVDAGVTGTITITVQVDVGMADETALTNVATFDYADANGNHYSQMSDDATTAVTAPVMSFSKEADVELANPGDTVTYTLTYKNTGTGMASLVVLVDYLPTHMTFSDATPYPDLIFGNTITWDIGDVAPGATETVVLRATVDAGTPDGSLLHNVATFDYADANGNSYPQLSDSFDVETSAPVMSFMKSADVTTADPGDQIVYTLHYENSGSGAATSVVIMDTLPEHVAFITASPYPDSISGRVLTWDVGTVGAHTSGDITITVMVDVGTPDGTFLVNTATLNYDDVNGNEYEQLPGEAQVTVTAPILHVNKVADVTEADPGDYITYTITYYNSGSGIATGVVITDTIPEHVTFVSSTPSYDQVNGRTYEWDIGTVLGDGNGGSVVIVVQVDAGTPDATLLHNAATLDYADANGNCYNQLSDDADTTVTAPVVDLTKTADVDEADPGDQITYTVTFTNSGNGSATDIYISDTIPEHVAFISSNLEYSSVSGRTYTWYRGSLGPGESITIIIVVEVDAYTPDQTLLHNSATADYDDDNGNPYPQLVAYADVVCTAPDFTFYKVADVDNADPGDEITYTLDWQNFGTGWASGVVIQDTLPNGAQFVSSSPTYTDVNGNVYTWDLGDVGPGEYGQIIITVSVEVGLPDKTILHNVAIVEYADANGNVYPPISDYADVQVTAPVLSFEKIGDMTTANPGDHITYQLCYENSGTGTATGVVVSDSMPNHVTFYDSTPLPDDQIGATLYWYIGNVGGGGGGCISLVVQVEPGTADRTLLHNTADLSYSDANGNQYPQMGGYWDVRVTAPVMTFAKSVDVDKADPGDYITYSLYYENTGTGYASGVIIADALPADVTLISTSIEPASIIGQDLTWDIGTVAPSTSFSITVVVMVNVGTADQTPLHNVATLDYYDANGNFIEQLSGYADAVVTAPVMTLDKTAGNITYGAFVMANFTIRIAGEKWHDVRLSLWDGNTWTEVASVTRYPGSPDDQSVTVYNVRVYVLKPFAARIVYTPLDDPINGQWWGDDPCWLILTFRDGDTKRLFHNFNVRHEDTWIWEIPDFLPYVKNEPITFEATIPYTIFYENIGTGDATNVVLSDILPAGAMVLNSSPAYDSCSGDACMWYIGYVAAGGMGFVFMNISYVFEVNDTVVTNKVTLDYSDANGNFIEQLQTFIDSVLVAPEIDGIKDINPINGDLNAAPGTVPANPEVEPINGALLKPTPAVSPRSEPPLPASGGSLARTGFGDGGIQYRDVGAAHYVLNPTISTSLDTAGECADESVKSLPEETQSGSAGLREIPEIPVDTRVQPAIDAKASLNAMESDPAEVTISPASADPASLPTSSSTPQACAFAITGRSAWGRDGE